MIEAIEAGKRGVREEAAARVEATESWRDAELERYERALAEIGGGGRPRVNGSRRGAGRKTRATAPRKSRRRRSGRASTSAASVAQRREDVFRFLSESTKPLASGELGQALGMSQHAVQTALRKLREERRIASRGSHASTKYVIEGTLRRSGDAAEAERSSGTVPGRIVETIADRGSATAEELAQALRGPLAQIVEACAALQAEGEIRMDRRNGRPVYVLVGGADA